MRRNVQIAYLLSFLKNSWFWLGIWVFYYLLYTDYTGIGLIEMSLIITMTLCEVPTGAVADLLGKKKTLFISFLLQALGGFMMAFAPNLPWLLFAVFTMGIGAAFYSGTLDALVYDSLKENSESESFGRVISHINSIGLIAAAVCGVIGGFLYLIQPNLPYLAHAAAYTIGVFLTLFLIEPKIDTEKFSFKSFIRQTYQGVRHLFDSSALINQTLLLLSVGVIVVICDEMLNAFMGVEYGFKAEELGIIWSIIYIVSAFASHMTPYIKRYLSYKKSILLVGLLIALSLISSPALGVILGGFSLLFRSSLQAIFINLSSVVINESTDSKDRATTLSTFNLLRNIPYILMAVLLGLLSDSYSAIYVGLYLGIITLILVLIQTFIHQKLAVER